MQMTPLPHLKQSTYKNIEMNPHIDTKGKLPPPHFETFNYSRPFIG